MNTPPPSAVPVRWTWRPHRPHERAEVQARQWLAHELRVPEPALDLGRDARNRPRLGAALGAFDCNWSHSGEHLLLALGAGVRVGVDVERVRPRPRALDLARRYFTAGEGEWLRAQPEGAARDAAFARLWCLKEALLKAHGHGLAFGLDRVAFAEADGRPRIAWLDPALGAIEDWHLLPLAAPAGYAAALVWRRLSA